MKRVMLSAALAAAMCLAFAGCGADGGDTSETKIIEITAGEETVLEDGTYEGFTIDYSLSGTEDSPTVVRAAEGASPVIKADPDYGIYLCNAHDVVLEGLTVEGGTHGIIYESLSTQGEESFDNITVKDCKVTGVNGVHGICFYAANDFAPVRNVTITGCEVSDCVCGDSESLVLNGNIDGFTISGNRVHDNDNIGIDMIGFEGTAKHPEDCGADNLYDADMVRNGKCFGNVVYNISSDGNPAYFEDGEYDLCADGIYVDGGQNIEIYNNFVYNCDIGIEVATEHSPEDNPLFRVSGIDVHDNVIADCEGWCGLCFGGYDGTRGFTEDCDFRNNTLIDNSIQIAVQRSKGNRICNNLLVGGETDVEFNSDCAEEDKDNYFDGNEWLSEEEALDGLRSKIDGVGSSFVPDGQEIDLWRK